MAQESCGCIFYCFFANSSLRVLLLFVILVTGDLSNMPNLPEFSRLDDLLVIGCICCACIAGIDAPLMMIVVEG